MTDKQIIIDGVDVSKCGHYHYGKCEIDYDEWNNEIIRYNECQDNLNCYYKQLKCKEQECDKSKQALDEIEKLIPKFDTSDGCSYGDYDCENCSDLDEDIVCTYKLKKVIKGIINKAKEVFPHG